MIHFYLPNPGICSMSTPITSRITRENITNKSPTIAAINLSRASWTAWGLLRDVIRLYPAAIIRRTAMPPAKPKKSDMIRDTKDAGLTLMSPIAVATCVHFPSASKAIHWRSPSCGGVVGVGTRLHVPGASLHPPKPSQSVQEI